jgi:hypothetical protein
MAHDMHDEVKKTRVAKMTSLVGHARHMEYPKDKAERIALTPHAPDKEDVEPLNTSLGMTGEKL